MKYLIAALLLGSAPLSLLSASECAYKLKELDACANLSWQLGPKYGIFSKATVTLKNAKGEAAANLPEFVFYPWMKMEGGHEHGARETVVKKLSEGVYEVSMIHLMKMPGHWELRIKKAGTKDKDDALVALPIEIK